MLSNTIMIVGLAIAVLGALIAVINTFYDLIKSVEFKDSINVLLFSIALIALGLVIAISGFLITLTVVNGLAQ